MQCVTAADGYWFYYPSSEEKTRAQSSPGRGPLYPYRVISYRIKSLTPLLAPSLPSPTRQTTEDDGAIHHRRPPPDAVVRPIPASFPSAAQPGEAKPPLALPIWAHRCECREPAPDGEIIPPNRVLPGIVLDRGAGVEEGIKK